MLVIAVVSGTCQSLYMRINWQQHVHDGWRRAVGVFCIVFAAALTGLFFINKPQLQTSEIIEVAPPADASEKVVEVTPEVTPSTSESHAGKINLLTATQGQLEELPGIGPAKAQAIMDYRAQYGFKNINDLDKVKGIGPATLELLRPLVEL